MYRNLLLQFFVRLGVFFHILTWLHANIYDSISKLVILHTQRNKVMDVNIIVRWAQRHNKKHGNAMKPGFHVTIALYLLKFLVLGSCCDECIMIYFKTSSFSKLAKILQSN